MTSTCYPSTILKVLQPILFSPENQLELQTNGCGSPLLVSHSTVYIRVHSWCCIFHGFRQMYNDIYPPFNIIQSIYTLKILCVLLIHTPTPSNHCFFYCLHSFAFSMSYSFSMQYVAFSVWLLSLSNMHLRFLSVFS